MKLLIYSHYFPPSIGGVETIVLALAGGMADFPALSLGTRFEVTLVTQTPRGNFEDGHFPFQIVRQPPLGQLWRLIRAADVLHLSGPSLTPLLFAYLARRPVVVEHHGFQTVCPNGQLFMESLDEPCPGHFMAHHHTTCLRCNVRWGALSSASHWLLTFVRRFLCSYASSNVVPTQWLGGQLGLPRTACLAHGLETIAPVPQHPRAGQPILAFQGRLVSTKGVAVLLEATRVLKEERDRPVKLLIIGDGPEREPLERLMRQKGLSNEVRFVGSVPAPQLEQMLSSVWGIVVPSVAGEVFGLVVAENMFRAIPVIASDLGPFVEILGNTGVVFRNQDPVDLADQIVKLLDDSAGATQLGRRARERAVDYYTRSRMIEAHARLYRSVVDR